MIRTLEQYQIFAESFNWNIFSFDTETDDLDYFKLNIEGISLYDGKHACYIDLWENPEKEDILSELWLQFSSAGILIGHNLVFDLEVLIKVWGKWNIYYIMNRVKLIDTYLAAYLIDERETCALKGTGGCCERFLNREALTYQDAKKYARNSPQFAKYATDDAVNTWDLWKAENPLLKEQGLEKVFDIECKFIPAHIELELSGILLDQELLKRLETDLDLMKCELEEQIVNCLGDSPLKQKYMFGTPVEALKLNSPKALPKLVKNCFGIELKSANKEAIKEHIGEHPFFELYLKYKAVAKLLSTYITPYLGLIKPDKRIHCEYHIIRSGRIIASHPNLDNQAKENELVPEVNIRKLFIVPKGKKFLKLDVSGQELRIAANNANEETMIRAFNQDFDVHMFVTNRRMNLGIPEDNLCENHPEYKEIKERYLAERTKFKSVNFGTIYGKTAGTFAREWKVPFWEAKKYLDGFFQLFPKIKDSINRNKAFLNKHLYSVTYLGRRRRYNKPLKKKDYRSSYNHTCQGGGADMMKKAVGEVWRYLQTLDFEARIVLWVHDEIIIEAPEDKIESLIQPVTNIINNTLKLKVKFKTNYKICTSYGD